MTDASTPLSAELSISPALYYISFMYLVTIGAGLSRRMGLSIDVAVLGGYAVILAIRLTLALE